MQRNFILLALAIIALYEGCKTIDRDFSIPMPQVEDDRFGRIEYGASITSPDSIAIEKKPHDLWTSPLIQDSLSPVETRYAQWRRGVYFDDHRYYLTIKATITEPKPQQYGQREYYDIIVEGLPENVAISIINITNPDFMHAPISLATIRIGLKSYKAILTVYHIKALWIYDEKTVPAFLFSALLAENQVVQIVDDASTPIAQLSGDRYIVSGFADATQRVALKATVGVIFALTDIVRTTSRD